MTQDMTNRSKQALVTQNANLPKTKDDETRLNQALGKHIANLITKHGESASFTIPGKGKVSVSSGLVEGEVLAGIRIGTKLITLGFDKKGPTMSVCNETSVANHRLKPLSKEDEEKFIQQAKALVQAANTGNVLKPSKTQVDSILKQMNGRKETDFVKSYEVDTDRARVTASVTSTGHAKRTADGGISLTCHHEHFVSGVREGLSVDFSIQLGKNGEIKKATANYHGNWTKQGLQKLSTTEASRTIDNFLADMKR